ncbi:MAG: Ig-like domain-containing protein [Planctomycetaceae bacterium]|jgi:hypothetical protein|nr:Ig-like domain-containing protein [Planctomycetaceae bacterium]
MLKKYFVAITCFCFIIPVGCKPSNPYGAVPVRGNITVDGNAVQGITVTFRSVSGNGISAYGLTDDQGNYVLTTGGAPFGTGTVPGKYHVTMSKVTNNEPPLTLEEYNALATSGKPHGNKPHSVTYQIPEKYSQSETSGFEPVDVKIKGSNIFDFKLVSTP